MLAGQVVYYSGPHFKAGLFRFLGPTSSGPSRAAIRTLERSVGGFLHVYEVDILDLRLATDTELLLYTDHKEHNDL